MINYDFKYNKEDFDILIKLELSNESHPQYKVPLYLINNIEHILCIKCKEYKSDYYKSDASYCKECKNILGESRRLKKTYGLDINELKQLKDKCDNKCEICKKQTNLVVDHDHSQNKPHYRGIICDFCNKGLGMFFDNKDTLIKAYYYLEKFDTQNWSK